MALKTYDIKNVTCIFGTVILRGYADGSAITVEPEENVFNTVVGSDGETTRSRTNNDNYKATVKLMQTSGAHADLQAQTLRNSALTGTTFPFKLIDGHTGETIDCAEAYVEKLPTVEYGRDASEREWVICLPAATFGNTVLDIVETLGSQLGLL